MITIYTGPMFSGKTTSLIAETQLAIEAGKKVLAIKPKIDKRFSEKDIVTHDGISFWNNTTAELQIVDTDIDFCKGKLFDKFFDCDLLVIDEVQFFENIQSIIELSQDFLVDIVCSGLDLDSNGKPFGNMPLLLIYANNIIKCTGKCSVCSDPSTRSYRKNTSNNKQIFIGGEQEYEPRCYFHWKNPTIVS